MLNLISPGAVQFTANEPLSPGYIAQGRTDIAGDVLGNGGGLAMELLASRRYRYSYLFKFGFHRRN
ncbi:MAG: hypothetical protein ABSH08_09710 [Tepidisphaeraceae bacterium]